MTPLLHTYLREPFAASVITLGEILVGAARAGQLKCAQALLEELGVEGVGLPPDAARRLGEIRARSGLKMPDCCVLYAAEQRGAAVATFDTKLADQVELLGLSVARQSV